MSVSFFSSRQKCNHNLVRWTVVDPYVQTNSFKTPVRVIRGIAAVVGMAAVSSGHWYQMTNDYEMTSSDDIHPIILKDSYVSYLALKPEYDNTPLTSTKSQPTQQKSSRIRIRIRICNQYLEISYYILSDRSGLQRCSCSCSISAQCIFSCKLWAAVEISTDGFLETPFA